MRIMFLCSRTQHTYAIEKLVVDLCIQEQTCYPCEHCVEITITELRVAWTR